MERIRPSHGHLAVVVALVLLFVLLLPDTATPPGARAPLLAVSELVAVRLDELPEAGEGRQLAIMKDVTDLLAEELRLHLRRAECLEKDGEVAFLRMEYEILQRWIEELTALSQRPMPDRNTFARRAERLLGLLEAHLEVEERLLQGALNGP